jgi:hypothetical protein
MMDRALLVICPLWLAVVIYRLVFIQKRVITGQGRKPLMIRYILLSTRWFGVYLHHLLRSDYDRAFHDHPWGFVTFLISGSYTEHRPNGQTTYSSPLFSCVPLNGCTGSNLKRQFGPSSFVDHESANGDSLSTASGAGGANTTT